MNYDIVFIPSFRRSIRKLKKRFPGVKKDVRLAIDILSENPKLGALIPQLSIYPTEQWHRLPVFSSRFIGMARYTLIRFPDKR